MKERAGGAGGDKGGSSVSRVGDSVFLKRKGSLRAQGRGGL